MFKSVFMSMFTTVRDYTIILGALFFMWNWALGVNPTTYLTLIKG